jgi:hypothetical protein
MHEIVVDELERHLSGTASRAFYQHLEGCASCRREVAGLESVSELLRELHFDPETALEPGPLPRLGFYNRVAYRIIDHERQQAWGLLAPGASFFRKVAFASLLALALLGSVLVSRESSYQPLAGPTQIMAEHDPNVDHPGGSDRDRMLVTLATYRAPE